MWLAIVISALTGYLLGNLNGSVCMSALVAKDDVRSHGSGNAGLTNFIRSYGAGSALGVLAIDVGKSVVACLAGGLMLSSYGYYLEGMTIGALAVIVGHCFPALLGFRGGKGILSGGAVAFILDWRLGLILLAVFAIAYLITGYVSVGSIMGALSFAVGFVVFYRNNWVICVMGIAIAALAIFMHRGNIARLFKGTEKKTNLFRKGKAQ